jgi:hypothetical protein
MVKSEEAKERRKLGGKKYYHEHLEQCREKSRIYARTHKEKRLEYQRTHKKSAKAAQRKSLYGITQEEFEKMLISQDNKCAICLEPFVGTPYVDHDHTTSKVRGLLCLHCNTMIGHARENSNTLLNGIRYLEMNRLNTNE